MPREPRALSAPPQSWPADLRDEWEERAGIIEEGDHKPRHVAEFRAAALIRQRARRERGQ